MRLKDKVAIITGAGSGIGAESARRFVEEGARVLIADMQDDKGQAIADELGDAAVFLHVDVSQEQHVEAAVAEAVAHVGKARHHLQQRRLWRRAGFDRDNDC